MAAEAKKKPETLPQGTPQQRALQEEIRNDPIKGELIPLRQFFESFQQELTQLSISLALPIGERKTAFQHFLGCRQMYQDLSEASKQFKKFIKALQPYEKRAKTLIKYLSAIEDYMNELIITYHLAKNACFKKEIGPNDELLFNKDIVKQEAERLPPGTKTDDLQFLCILMLTARQEALDVYTEGKN